MTQEFFVGLMSGTSLDGVDAVLAEFTDGRLQVAADAYVPFDETLQRELLALNSAGQNEIERAALAGNELARKYAAAVAAVLARSKIPASSVRAIGCHGQTIRHRPGRGYTTQIGNAALLAELTGITVVADFRSRDVASGGQGAPLAPGFHADMFTHGTEDRIVINLGGIANLTYLPHDGEAIGFDSGLSSYPNNGAQIRVESPFESICGGCADDTEFLDMTPASSAFTDGALVVGQSFVDTAKGITFSTIAQAGGLLTVSVAAPTRPSFVDVPVSHPDYANIETVYWYGITQGCGTAPLKFCPTGTVSRAEMAVFIERATRGEAFVGTATGSLFSDVPAAYWAGGPIV